MEQRLHDIELAVIELARVTEHVLIENKTLKGDERKGLLHAIDHVRALCTPETSDDPDDDPPAAAALFPGFYVRPADWLPPGYLALGDGAGRITVYAASGRRIFGIHVQPRYVAQHVARSPDLADEAA